MVDRGQIDGVRLSGQHPILMLDDDPIDIEAAIRCHRLSGIENPLVTFSSSDAFLDYLNQVAIGNREMPALVLMDIRMPGRDGFDVIELLRALPALAQMPPVVMLTTSKLGADRERATALGCRGYFIKPSSFREYTSFFQQLVA